MKYNKIKELIQLLFKSQVEAHLTHIVQPSKTLSKHEALSIYYTSLEDLRKPIKETFIQNQVDECQQLIAHTLYRLKNIIT